MSDATEAQVQESPPEQKAKAKHTGDLIFDIAHEVETMGKQKALNTAVKLADEIDENFFKLGGILKVIVEQQWYEGYPSYEAFLLEKFDFAKRKSDYLIKIYTTLVKHQIPYQKVAKLGWTKTKELVDVITAENVDEWVAKALPLTVAELKALLKSLKPESEGKNSGKTTDEVVTMKFKLHKDQAEVVQSALAKAKGEMNTEVDTVAISSICSGYLAGAVSLPQTEVNLIELFKQLGYKQVLTTFGEVFPEIDVDVSVPEKVSE